MMESRVNIIHRDTAGASDVGEDILGHDDIDIILVSLHLPRD